MRLIRHWFNDLANLIHPSTECLIAQLGDTGTYGAMGALVRQGRLAVEPLIEALRDPQARASVYAAEALGQIGDARAVESLIIALRDSRYGVRASAARALGQLRDTRAVEPLIAAVGDPDRNVTTQAIEALVHIGDRRALEPLAHLAWDRYDQTARVDAIDERAIKALGRIGGAEALPKLELARRRVSEEYVRALQGCVYPMEAEGIYNYFSVPLEAIDWAIANIRVRSTA